MTETEKRVPDLRFKGFIEDWEQRKLAEVGELNRGKSKHRPRNAAKLFGGKYPFIQTGDVAKAGLYLTNYVQTYSDFGIQQSKLWNEGTLLITIAANIAETSILGIKAAFPDSVIAFESDDVDMIFVKNVIDKISDMLKRTAETSSQANLNLAKLAELKIDLPSISEQTQIGLFLKQLEKTIDLHLDKQQQLNLLKKRLLKELFPQHDENLPHIRFANFNETWEQRKLGETVQITMGQSPNGENYTEDPKDHILVQGNADMKNGRVSPRVWTTQVTKKGDPEDIILSVRAPVGDVGKTNYPVVLGRGVAGIKGNAFIFQTLSRMKEIGFWTKYSSGSTFESINSADLKEAVIQIPNIEEQIKIGDFFTKLDDTIALHQQKIDNMQSLKKVLLNKMFI